MLACFVMKSRGPSRRQDDVLLRRIDAELVIHDTRTGQISHLNELTTSVWDLSDGQHDVADIAARTGTSEQEVEATLGHLAASGLLQDHGIDRRKLLARMGAVALIAPIVTIMAPAAAAAASPLVPDVGTWSHTCRGAHTSTFTLTLIGLPPFTAVRLSTTWSNTFGALDPSDPTVNTTTTDSSGVATFTWSFRDRGSPISARTVILNTYQLPNSAPITISGEYTGRC